MADGSHGAPLTREELGSFLNALLEAERAGARVLRVFAAQMPIGEEALLELQRVQRDESRNCALLLGLLRKIGAEPSKRTGDFAERAIAVEGVLERLEFLNRGQAWVARRIAGALARVEDPEVREVLAAMHDSHLANVAACEEICASLLDGSPR